MHESGVKLNLLASLAHGIETAGAFLDDKPFKAKGQGKKRFNKSLNKLFPQAYSEANRKLDLYGQLRSHISHCMLPAKSILIEHRSTKHLHFEESVLHLSLQMFFTDYVDAMEKLLDLMKTGKFKNKRIVFDNLNLD
jgi:hypothetical protein